MPAATKSSALARPMFLTAGLALAVAAPIAHAQSTIEWATPVDGDFGASTNWFPAVVPGPLDTAVLGGMGPYTVSVNASRTVDAVDLANP